MTEVFIVWRYREVDGQEHVIGYCKTKDLAERSVAMQQSLEKPGVYSYRIEELEELLED